MNITIWILEQLKVEKELLGRVKSLKMGYYGHVVRKYNCLEKEVGLIQGCIGAFLVRSCA